MLLRSIIPILLSIFVLINPVSTRGETTKIDLIAAERYFQEVKAVCAKDDGKLWGEMIYGPIMLIDPTTRSIVANQADKNGLLKQQNNLYIGQLPENVIIANTSIDLAGVKWAMIMWPLPSERQLRLQLMTHELFHRIQNRLNLIAANPANNHLDEKDGRLWLRLELRALNRAIQEQGSARRQAIIDAVSFRNYRHNRFPHSADEEALLEFNEGLAEYTGYYLTAHSPAELGGLIGYNLRDAHFKSSYVRSFAYATGPAYGFLLDLSVNNWREIVRGNNRPASLAELLQKHLQIILPELSETEMIARAGGYDGDEIIADETARDVRRKQLLARYREKLVETALLIMPTTENINYSFNPNNLIPLDQSATIYPTLRVVDDWGILEVSDGALLCRENGRITKVQVSASNQQLNNQTLIGSGWKLVLNPGWTISASERKGDQMVKRVQ